MPLVIRHAHEKVIAGDARIVDQNVDTAHGVSCLFRQRLNGLGVAQIAGQYVGPLAQLGGQRLQRLNPCSAQAHGCAGPMQGGCDGRSDPARCAGDQRFLIRQIKHVSPPEGP